MGEVFILEETKPLEDGVDFVTIPEDSILEAEVLSIEKVTKPFTDDNGNPVQRIEFAFKILDENYQNRRVWGDTSTTFTTHPDCRLRAWVQEILAAPDLEKNFRFDTDALIGTHCRVVIGVRRWTDKQGVAQERNTVKDVIRSRTTSTVPNLGENDPF